MEQQPEGETNRNDKLCACCETKTASKFCTKCHCTPYCSRDCQTQHWKNGHKRHCLPDPLHEASASALPSYRPYEESELELNLFYKLSTGKCAAQPTDNRDAMCQLIAKVEFEALPEEYRDHPLSNSRFTLVPTPTAESFGWQQVTSELVAGYSQEDKVQFRAFFDALHQSNDQLQPNLIAGSFVNCELECRGPFVVAKVERQIVVDGDGSDKITETLVPFAKTELVDLCVWRRFCGSNLAAVSSRVFRENMRRKELEGYLKQNNQNQTMIDL